MKVLLVGLPLFVIQLVAVYFITANILLNKYQAAANKKAHPVEKTEDSQDDGDGGDGEDSGSKKEAGKFLFSVDEIIINPTGTDGKRLLLTSVGFDVKTDAQQKELKEKEILVKDIVISVLSSKNLTQLNDISYKDTLKMQIKDRMKEKLPKIKVNDVYFSKYIIQ